jgi:hypothetical protein
MCEAVGYYQLSATGPAAGFAERWNGTSWSMQTTPTPAGKPGALLLDVACTSAIACTAVGQVSNSSGTAGALAEKWDGTSWQAQSTPNPRGASAIQFNAASCTSATTCEAVGAAGSASRQLPFAERYG